MIISPNALALKHDNVNKEMSLYFPDISAITRFEKILYFSDISGLIQKEISLLYPDMSGFSQSERQEIKAVGVLEEWRKRFVQLADHLVDGLLPGWLVVLNGLDRSEELTQRCGGYVQEALRYL